MKLVTQPVVLIMFICQNSAKILALFLNDQYGACNAHVMFYVLECFFLDCTCQEYR